MLRILVILTLIRCLIAGNYESAALCILSLLLFLIPALAEDRLKIKIPETFEIIIFLFIYSAEILGEISHYYVLIPGWDTALHTMNGFLCAAVGYSLVDLINRNSKNLHLSPFYLAMVAFCFSMTIGVVWEFFEFNMDMLFALDMQKDFVVTDISSVTLDPAGMGTPISVSGISRTIIETASGEIYTIEGGYLDIGIIDTMKDLIVNFVGAMVFSVFGYLYAKGVFIKWVPGLMLRYQTEEEISEADRRIDENRERKRRKPAERMEKLPDLLETPPDPVSEAVFVAGMGLAEAAAERIEAVAGTPDKTAGQTVIEVEAKKPKTKKSEHRKRSGKKKKKG